MASSPIPYPLRCVSFGARETILTMAPRREVILKGALEKAGVQAPLQVLALTFLRLDCAMPKPILKLESQEAELAWKKAYYRKLTELLGLSLNRDKILHEIEEAFRWKSRWVVDPLAVKFFKYLKSRRLKCVVVANWEQDLPTVLESLEIDKVFDVIVTSGREKMEKPNSDIFRLAISQAGVRATETLHIGSDYRDDIMGARETKIAAMLFDRYNLYPLADCMKVKDWREAAKRLDEYYQKYNM